MKALQIIEGVLMSDLKEYVHGFLEPIEVFNASIGDRDSNSSTEFELVDVEDIEYSELNFERS